MVTEAQSPYDPDEHRRDAMMDGSGFSAADAYRRHPDPSRDDDTRVALPRTIGRSIKMSRPGYVRDYEGRADQFRGDSFGIPLDDDAKIALENALPNVHDFQDSLRASSLRRKLEAGQIDELSARAQIRAYLDGHGRDITNLVFPDDVNANQS